MGFFSNFLRTIMGGPTPGFRAHSRTLLGNDPNQKSVLGTSRIAEAITETLYPIQMGEVRAAEKRQQKQKTVLEAGNEQLRSWEPRTPETPEAKAERLRRLEADRKWWKAHWAERREWEREARAYRAYLAHQRLRAYLAERNRAKTPAAVVAKEAPAIVKEAPVAAPLPKIEEDLAPAALPPEPVVDTALPKMLGPSPEEMARRREHRLRREEERKRLFDKYRKELAPGRVRGTGPRARRSALALAARRAAYESRKT